MPDSPRDQNLDLGGLDISQLKKKLILKVMIYSITVAAALGLLLYLSRAEFSEIRSKIRQEQRTSAQDIILKIHFNSAARKNGTQSTLQSEESNIDIAEFVDGRYGNFEPLDEPPWDTSEDLCKKIPVQDPATRSSQATYKMNIACSDRIPLNRSIPDLRDEECLHWNYPKNLPTASVIIIFNNEGFSALMRTVHSVIDRTPRYLLEEVILVDDFSNKEDLKSKLESYIQIWNGTVQLVRNKKREGLINSKSRGAHEAHGEVIVFLDAHCEVGINWLPPLLAPIHKNRKTMTVPIIDVIDDTTFEVKYVYPPGVHFKGVFEWGLSYKEIPLTPRENEARDHQSEPYASPTHAGGLFAINREYFLELGTYDPGLLIWGGENFELSFKIWQCGGRILWVPCSSVAHVYKSHMPRGFGSLKWLGNGTSLSIINYKRVVETWMDGKHKEYFYTREPIARFLDMGDISEQMKLKEKLHCKSFQWFMDKVAHGLTYQFPEPPPNVHWGEMENVGTHLCLDTLGREAPTKIGVSSCLHIFHRNQLVRLNTQGQLGIQERCVDADSTKVMLKVCRFKTVSGPWRYNDKTIVMYHTLKKKCLAVDHQTTRLSLMHCDPPNPYQQWRFNEVLP